MTGLPDVWNKDTPPPGIDYIGKDVRWAETVTCYRLGTTQGRGISIGEGSVIFEYVRLVTGDLLLNLNADIKIGNQVWINTGAYISGEGGLYIGDKVLIGPGAKLLSAGHVIDGPPQAVIDHGLTYGAIHIGDGAWIGAGACILQGRNIGEGAVVGAGAVITKDVDPFSIVAGNPARFIRWRKGFEPKTSLLKRILKARSLIF
ncbi:MAG: acyltransferase [Dissulfurimicrobium sp.]|uniref:acyltransferase n=1 Tax=Dissulfurimicrobium TaxID=1769732 RepID=UPI003C76B199